MCLTKTLKKCPYLVILLILNLSVKLTLALLDPTHKFLIDYSENTEFIQERTGNDIKLQCNLNGLIDDKQFTDIKIHWYFKQCSDGESTLMRNCHESFNSDWIKLPCEQQFCQKNLILRNVSEKYSGFYKCTVQPYHLDEPHNLDIKLVRTFQLDIKNSSLALPEFMGSSLQNRTSLEGSQVVFPCHVRSEEHPTIRWFKRQTDNNNNSYNGHIVQYNGFNYVLLNTAREKLISNEIYLSKLILKDLKLKDEGFYACVAISYRGYNMREAYLQIKSLNLTDNVREEESVPDRSEFLLLFLMPLGLAMLPLSFLSCYCAHKRCKKNNKIQKWSLQFPDEEMGTEHNILNT